MKILLALLLIGNVCLADSRLLTSDPPQDPGDNQLVFYGSEHATKPGDISINQMGETLLTIKQSGEIILSKKAQKNLNDTAKKFLEAVGYQMSLAARCVCE